MNASSSTPGSTGMSREPLDTPSSGVIGRQLAIGFGLVSVVSVLMCAILLSLFGQVSGQVAGMQSDEVAIRESLSLSVAVREQYMHQAHWIIERDDEHLHHYAEWLESIESSISDLAEAVPESERGRVRELSEQSAELDRVFRERLQPAVVADNHDDIVRHHREANVLAQAIAHNADAIAASLDERMSHAHVSATHTTRLALVVGGLCVLLVVSLSAAFTLRLRQAVLQPLGIISDAARRFGRGDFSTRVGQVGRGEFGVVSEAFDRMVEELEVREHRLVESERMAAIGQLAAGVAHEVNNPIQIIRGYLKTMIPEANSEALEEELKILDEEAEACQRIAEDLVSYSRPTEPRRQPLQMDQLLEESIRRFADAHREGQAVDTQIEPGIVEGDAARIRQVLANLLLNAAQVSSGDDPILVRGRHDGSSSYVIEVVDAGPGVTPGDITRIFEPFFSKRKGGSGLGLAVCQGIVRSHGGSIHVENRDAGGARFIVSLPLSSGATQ